MHSETPPLKLSLLLTTGRTLKQGVAMEKGKLETEYELEAAAVELDQVDAKTLGVAEGALLRVASRAGKIVLPCRISRMDHPGVAFIPMGPWANSLVNAETQGLGMPSYKNVPVTVTIALGQAKTTMSSIINQLRSIKWRT